MKRAVFLDRDGVLNRDSDDFIRTVDEVEMLPGVPEAVRRLNDAGFLTVVITNQSGIARGFFTEEALSQIHRNLIPQVESAGGKISAVYYCPHIPQDGCNCRKPLPGMLEQAAREHNIDLAASYLVGDRPEDMACGNSVGARTILVLTGKSLSFDPARFTCRPHHVAMGLPEAAAWILSDCAGASATPCTAQEA